MSAINIHQPTRIIQTTKLGFEVYVVVHLVPETSELKTTTFLSESAARQFAARNYRVHELDIDVVGPVELIPMKTSFGHEFDLEVEHNWLTNRRTQK